jgi:hypothetical protein
MYNAISSKVHVILRDSGGTTSTTLLGLGDT